MLGISPVQRLTTQPISPVTADAYTCVNAASDAHLLALHGRNGDGTKIRKLTSSGWRDPKPPVVIPKSRFTSSMQSNFGSSLKISCLSCTIPIHKGESAVMSQLWLDRSLELSPCSCRSKISRLILDVWDIEEAASGLLSSIASAILSSCLSLNLRVLWMTAVYAGQEW